MLSLLRSLTLLALIGTQVTTAPIPSEITVEPYEQGQIYGKCEREGHIIYDLYTVAGIGWNIKEKDIKYILEGKPSPENRVPRMIKDWQFEEEWENGIQSFALKFRTACGWFYTFEKDLNRIQPLDMKCDEIDPIGS